MIPARPLSLVMAVALCAGAAGQDPPREVENVATFARLYGVVRYFYPSDAAASLDWDAFAVHGVRQVRAAADRAALEPTLEALFLPLGPGIEIGATLPAPPPTGEPDASLIAWRYMGPGVSSAPSGPYRGKRTNRTLVVTSSIDGFVSMMQTVEAEPLRGKRLRLRGRVRATALDSTGRAALWLRVDRPEQQIGFFDNMSGRPIRDRDWRNYTIEGVVAEDAAAVVIGVMASGAVTADFDAIELAVSDGSGGWTTVVIQNGGFDDATAGWTRAGTSRTGQVNRVTETATDGKDYLLRLGPPAVPPITMELMGDVPPVARAHVDVDLGSRLRARVPLVLSDSEAVGQPTTSSRLDALRAALTNAREPISQLGVATRLADVVVAWSVFRHFYPYWTEAGVDWDSRLQPLLALASKAETRQAHRDALRQLIADVRDGHGSVTDTSGPDARAVLPLRLAIVEDRLVVTASNSPDVPVGSVIAAIDSAPAMKRIADAMALASGTPQWKQTRALQEIAGCERGSTVNLAVDNRSGSRTVGLRCDATQLPGERRPDPISELSGGIWYVDLTRANMTQITPKIETLARAAGVVFDVRGYPTDSGARILPYLIDAAESDRWMHIARIVGPFHQTSGWQSVGWNVGPLSPRFAGKIVFLTDGRAISYAESVMGYVKDRKLGTILGSPTAGANGNVVGFLVPGGFNLTFTGMRVTGHDGQTPHHLQGVQPDIPIAPTLASIRNNRDDVLERAIELIRGK